MKKTSEIRKPEYEREKEREGETFVEVIYR